MATVKYQDLDLAGRDRRWDAQAAEKRVRAWAGAEDGPNDRYRTAFAWYDPEDAEHFRAYKFPIADVVRAKLKAVPRAIISAAAVIDGARGGADIPAKDRAELRAHLGRYYAKMKRPAPWEKS